MTATLATIVADSLTLGVPVLVAIVIIILVFILIRR